MKSDDVNRIIEQMTTNKMSERTKELAEQAGFECWKDEPYRPEGQTIDWASNYDEELEKFAELVRADERYGRGEKPPVKTYAGGKPNYCTPEVPCKTDPDAPHGFDRNASHSADRYVCECEGWEPPREWVGLTPLEFNSIKDTATTIGYAITKTEAILREKNG